nr:hypothetical protein CPGR_01284 [Mycolicibacter nonchromogenicus]
MLELPIDGKAFESLRAAQEYAAAIDSNTIRVGELSGT